uniref:Uncharacterized protein n=1 Tax=Leersia perrieri TaxID=77586 RepID=A0A0D9V9I1_9ORYZ
MPPAWSLEFHRTTSSSRRRRGLGFPRSLGSDGRRREEYAAAAGAAGAGGIRRAPSCLPSHLATRADLGATGGGDPRRRRPVDEISLASISL